MINNKKILINTIITVTMLIMISSIAFTNKEGSAFEGIANYKYGNSRNDLDAVEKQVLTSKPKEHAGIEEKLLKILNSSSTTDGGKDFACRMLRLVGSEKSIPSLEKLFDHEKLSHMACFALERLSGPKVNSALLKAVKKTKHNVRIGLINELGKRRAGNAVEELSKLISSKDKGTSRAVINALSRISTKHAVKVLRSAKISKGLEIERSHALLRCGDNLIRSGDLSDAAGIYKGMLLERNPIVIRSAAIIGYARSKKEDAVDDVMKMLKSKYAVLQAAALKAFLGMPGSNATKVICSKLEGSSSEIQVSMLNVIGKRKDKTARPYVEKFANDKNKDVSITAIRALSSTGDVSSISLLIKKASKSGDTGLAAEWSLCRITGRGIHAMLVKLMDKGDSKQKVTVLNAMGCRGEKKSISHLIKKAFDKDRKVRRAACDSLAKLAGEKEMPKLLDLLMKNPDSSQRSSLKKTIFSIAGRVKDVDKNAGLIIKSYKEANKSIKVDLLEIMGRIGGEEVYNEVKKSVKSNSPDIKKAGIKALGAWKNTKPMEELIRIAKNEKDLTYHVLALRGYIDMFRMNHGIACEDGVKMLEEAMKIAKRIDEKKAVLGALPVFICDASKKFAGSYLENPDLKDEAGSALAEIDRQVKKKSKGKKK